MNEKPLMKWGGICAYVYAVVWAISVTLYWIAQGGIPSQPPSLTEWADMTSCWTFRTYNVLYPFVIILHVTMLFAAYEYLRKSSFGLAKVGFGFGILFNVFCSIVWTISNASKTAALLRPADLETQLAAFLNLQGSAMIFLLWFSLPYLLLWGLAFKKLESTNIIVGYVYLVAAVLAVLIYVLQAAGSIIIVNICLFLYTVSFVISTFFIAQILTAEAKKT